MSDTPDPRGLLEELASARYDGPPEAFGHAFASMAEALREVLELHVPRTSFGTTRPVEICKECIDPWPCLTARAISEALGGDSHG